MEYKVVIYREPIFSALIFAASNVDPERFTRFMNDNAAQGWKAICIAPETRRTLLFFKREAFIVIMERSK